MLTTEHVQQYDGRHAGNPFERLAALRQTSTVETYIFAFIELIAQVPDLNEQYYLDFFLKGLMEAIQVRLRTHDRGDLDRAMELARRLKVELQFANESSDSCQVPAKSGVSFALAPHRSPTSTATSIWSSPLALHATQPNSTSGPPT